MASPVIRATSLFLSNCSVSTDSNDSLRLTSSIANGASGMQEIGIRDDASPSQLRHDATGFVAVHRIVPRAQAERAFSSLANRAGGRWSSVGTPAVYASQTAAGAVLEFLAHMEGDRADDLVLLEARLPSHDVVEAGCLPRDWRQIPYRDDVRAFGDRWLASHGAVALQLPSVLCEASRNLLINPDHARIGALEVVQVQPFTLDRRLVAAQ